MALQKNTQQPKINKFFLRLGKSCFIFGGAVAGFPIGGLVGIGLGAILGGVLGNVLERSMENLPFSAPKENKK